MELIKVLTLSDVQPGFLEIMEHCLNLSIEFCII